MKKIGIVGKNGRMGKLIYKRLLKNHEVCGIDRNENIENLKGCDLVIDFSVSNNSKSVSEWCNLQQIPLIIGTTGQSDEDLIKIKNCSKRVPILMSGNFSLGVFYIKKMLETIDKDQIESMSIFEKHHKHKKDNPSGTAKELKKYCEQVFGKNVSISSIRGGEEIGTHEIYFYLKSEVVKISHEAFSRKCFVDGLEKAAEFMLNKNENKLFSFEDVFKI